MDNDLYQQLKRNLLMFEQAGMPEDAAKVRARLAELEVLQKAGVEFAQPEPEPEPEPKPAAAPKASGKSKIAPKED